jgi:hypothetical protein
MVYTPSNRFNAPYDTWFYRRPNTSTWILNFLCTHDPIPGRRGENLGWNAYAEAISVDGVHFADTGLALRRECPDGTPDDQCTQDLGPSIGHWPANVTGIGSGSIVKLLKAPREQGKQQQQDDDDEEEEFVMNYSQQHPCLFNASIICQSIFFAHSTDLLNWQPYNDDDPSPREIFQANGSFYHTSASFPGARTDTISALPRPGGGYVGYFTATPLSNTAANSSNGSINGGGAGMAVSDDGLHWTALPSPGPNFVGEMGGVCQLGDKVYMTFSAGHLVSAQSIYGPFTAETTNYDFLTTPQGEHYRAAGYPRLWGETNTGDAGTCLVTHGFGRYVGIVKRAVVGADGALRAGWWENNDILRGPALPFYPGLPHNDSAVAGSQTRCVGQCMSSGLWLEGTLSVNGTSQAGLWLQTGGGGWASTVGGGSVFSLASTDADGKHTHSTTVDRGDFLRGEANGRAQLIKVLARSTDTHAPTWDFVAQGGAARDGTRWCATAGAG